MKHHLACLFVLIYSFGLVACSVDDVTNFADRMTATPIDEIVLNPAKYENEEVKVHGKVIESINLLFIKYFYISDGTESIAVLPAAHRQNLPTETAEITIRGKVKQQLKIGDLQLIALEESE